MESTTEIEVKIRVGEKDLPRVRGELARLGFRRKAAREKEENLLLDYSSRSLTEAGSALRLRQYGQKQILTYKGPRVEDATLKIREEIETEIGDFASMKRMLEALGMSVCFEYGKYREKYELLADSDNVEVCIDETPVGCFLEIEGSPESIEKTARALGWSADDFINENYIDLYKKQTR